VSSHVSILNLKISAFSGLIEISVRGALHFFVQLFQNSFNGEIASPSLQRIQINDLLYSNNVSIVAKCRVEHLST
jgi:hypothetical protein